MIIDTDYDFSCNYKPGTYPGGEQMPRYSNGVFIFAVGARFAFIPLLQLPPVLHMVIRVIDSIYFCEYPPGNKNLRNTPFYSKVASFEKDKIAELSAEAKRIQKTG